MYMSLKRQVSGPKVLRPRILDLKQQLTTQQRRSYVTCCFKNFGDFQNHSTPFPRVTPIIALTPELRACQNDWLVTRPGSHTRDLSASHRVCKRARFWRQSPPKYGLLQNPSKSATEGIARLAFQCSRGSGARNVRAQVLRHARPPNFKTPQTLESL